jgi:MFS family permease
MLPNNPLDSRQAWIVVLACLCCLGMSFGAPLIATIGLKVIAAETGGARSTPAAASSLAWLGSAVGGLIMGRVAHRYSVKWTVAAGGVSVAAGLALSTLGGAWSLYIGHGVFIGLLGLGALNAPLYVYVGNWFERRRGSALALLAGGLYIAGTVWPVIFEWTIGKWGWRSTMIGFGLLQAIVVVGLALKFLQPAPGAKATVSAPSGNGPTLVFGLRPGLAFAMLCAAGFLCCIPMAMPQGHLVALCSDLGISARVGAAMLSLLLASAFLSRQAWGLIADRIGGLQTALISSTLQVLAFSGYLFVTQEFGLFSVSIAFGMGFSALVPAYALAVRENFPVGEAHWRVPTVLLMTGSGMVVGGWLAGFLHDRFASYDYSFMAGVGFNIVNLILLSTLTVLMRRSRDSIPQSLPAGLPPARP